MRILIVTQYFPPEVGAPQTRLFELAKELKKHGVESDVLTAIPHYPTGRIPAGYRWRLWRREAIDGVRVDRVLPIPTPRGSAAARIANQLSFAVGATIMGVLLRRPDVVFGESPPLFVATAARLIALFHRCPFIMNVADVWPESAVQLGMLHSRLLIGLAEKLERWLYRASAVVTVVTPGIGDRISTRLDPEKLRALTNGADILRFSPEVDGSKWRRQHGIGDEFLIVYAGTHGLSQGLEVIAAAAHRLRDRKDVLFLLVGDGPAKAGLIKLVRELRLTNLRLVAPVPSAEMPEVLAAANACVVPLRKLDIFRQAIPSKVYEALAAGRPILLGVAGEAEALLTSAGAAIAYEPEDSDGLARAVRHLADRRDIAAAMGVSARRLAVERFSRAAIAAEFVRILASVDR